jgi:hypothetical protein
MSARGFSVPAGGAGWGREATVDVGGVDGAGVLAAVADHVGVEVAAGGVNAAVEAGLDGAGADAAAGAEMPVLDPGVPSACAAATDWLVGCAAATDWLVGCAAATDWLVGCTTVTDELLGCAAATDELLGGGDFGGAAVDPGGTADGALAPAPAVGAAVATSPSPMMPTTVLMGTVAPGSTRISLSTPEAGAGISASTLSVEISKSGSSRWTRSPTFFIHLVIVPSAMDSPIWGMMTSVIR